MAHEYAKDAKASHAKKLKSYGASEKESTPKNWAGFDALNTDKQAGRAPTSSTEYEAPERRIQKKKGGAVSGAASLKRLDKAPRKGKASGGARVGKIPSPDEMQEEFDETVEFTPGEMSPGTMRKKGGKVQDYEARSHESTGARHSDEKEDRALVKKMVKSDALTGKSYGGRAKRADGGALGDGSSEGKKTPMKGKTTVNIVIGGMDDAAKRAMQAPAMTGMTPGPSGQPMMPPPPPPPPMMGAPGGMPPMMPPGGAPPMGPPPGMPPLPRKDGGAVQVPYKKPGRKGEYPAMDFGSGSGFGRKQKVDAYGTKGPSSKDNY